jgi:hypothetical protein
MWGIGDRATIKALEALAAEFDAKAAAILSMAIGSQLKNITLRGNDDPASILETDNDADDDNAG